MRIRTTSLILLLLFCLPAMAAEQHPPFATAPYPLTAADKAVLVRVEKYLSGIHTIVAGFDQAAPSGDLSSGRFFLMRPGKLRMEYSPPTPVLMVARNGSIAYYDKELDQVSYISLESSLVGFLAREKVAFDDSVVITELERSNNAIRLSLVQSKRPRDGSLTLVLYDNPLVLRKMTVTDSSGQTTTVSLNNARFDVPLEEKLFIFKDPHPGQRSIKK